MKKFHKPLSVLLSLILMVQLLPTTVLATSEFAEKAPGQALFGGEDGDRLFVSETAYELAPGITEYVTQTNIASGMNQNIDFFCEANPKDSNVKIVGAYAGMENILENNTVSWRMQTVSDQVKATQSYYNRSAEYDGYNIVAALNADFYNMATGEPTGLLVIGGKQYHAPNGNYYFGIKKDGSAVITNDTSDATITELDYAVGGANLLVKNGQINIGSGGRNVTYSAVGIKEDGTVVSMVCYGQRYPISCGYTLIEVAKMMQARGCVSVLQLDGSGSSTFVSRRAGEDSVSTRNNPSDGQERQVSSSIFFISTAVPDGIFDHAVLSPSNEVYTPRSEVTFSAIGADKSGAHADLPSGLTWAVDENYGTMNGSTFTSTGATGDVAVSLMDGDAVVGSTTITIANPDQITFAAETASMGNGDTGDLGLRVYYQQREVNYKDGDLVWEITPTQYNRKEFAGGKVYNTIVETEGDRMQYLTLGTISNNLLTIDPVYTGTNLVQGPEYVLTDQEKTASAITATVKVSSTANAAVSGTVTLEACKDPVVAMDFEQTENKIIHTLTGYQTVFDEDGNATVLDAALTLADMRASGYNMMCFSGAGQTINNTQVGSAEFVDRANGYPVRFGQQSLKIDYDFSNNKKGTDGVYFGYTEDINLGDLGNPTAIGIWIYIPKNTPNLWIRLAYRDGLGNSSFLDFSDNNIYREDNIAHNADGSWHYFEADISTLATPVTIPAGMMIRVMQTNYGKQSSGAAKVWASPVGWTKCKTDENGNILWVDVNNETEMKSLTEYVGGQFHTPTDIYTGIIPESYTKKTGETVTIEKLPIPDFMGTYGTDGVYTGGDSAPMNMGTLYFDQLTYVYGSTPEDTTPPVIDSVKVNVNDELTSGMTLTSSAVDIWATYDDSTAVDRSNTGVSQASLYVDGREVQCSTNNASELRTGLKLANGVHTIKISVVDGYGNEATREYTVTVNDPAGDSAPVTVTANEATAVLGKTVTLEFTPRDSSVTGMSVDAKVGKDYATDFLLTDASGSDISSAAVYNEVTETISFDVSGAVDIGSMASLTLHIPTTAPVGYDLGLTVSGSASIGDESSTFTGNVSLPISAPYTVTSGELVAGVADTCYFTVTHTATGMPTAGVTLYRGDTALGISDAEGKVSCTFDGTENAVTVYARGENGISAPYTKAVSKPAGNADGTPTHVRRNSANSATELNVSWFANPLAASAEAKIQISEDRAALEASELQNGVCALTIFPGDSAAAYTCGVKVTGLNPGTTYYYRVGDGTHWSDVLNFTTQYLNTDTKMLIFGDLQEEDNTTLSGILSGLTLSDYNATIQTGDLVDNGGKYTYWDTTLGMISGIDNSRVFATGNHEMEGGLDINKLIYNQSSNYSSALYGNVFVATLAYNSFSSDVLNRLIADAQASQATWKILVMHQPVYYTNAAVGMSSATQQAIYEAAQQAGIDVVLSGHDHSYARTEPLYNDAMDQEKGITYFICGSLGEKSYAVDLSPGFHFAKTSGNFGAVYMTLSTTSNTLTIKAYDYNDGSTTELDSFTKTKGDSSHTHSYTWDGNSRLVCDECGYNTIRTGYTGFAAYDGGRVYFNAGNLMTDQFPVGDEILHAGKDGKIHNTETVNTAQCWEDGHMACWCKDCNKFYVYSAETRRQGHQYDENHICTRKVFDTTTYKYVTCGYQGKDIATLDISLAYDQVVYDGSERRPAVTVKDGETVLTPQSTYGDYMPYWDNNVEVGRATVRIVGYSDGPYYGETTRTFDILPNSVTRVNATLISGCETQLTWTAPAGATAYKIYREDNDTKILLGTTENTEYTVKGLDAGTYQILVQAVAMVNDIEFASTDYASTSVTFTGHIGGTATCQSKAVCTTCGLEYGDLGEHNYGSWTDEIPATEEQPGVKGHYQCSVCEKYFDAVYQEISNLAIPAIKHVLTQVPAKAATCTEVGNNEYWTCSECAKVFKADQITETTVEAETLSALGHSLIQTQANAATYSAPGNIEYYSCSACHKYFSDAEGTTEIEENSWVIPQLVRPSSGDGSSTTYAITVDSSKNGDVTVSSKSASKGRTVTITVKPDDCYELDELTVTDKNGDAVKVTKVSDTKYIFTMPASKVTVEADFAKIVDANEDLPFTDVVENAYYYDAVVWALDEGITGGTSATTFSPNASCTRAQTVTFLWRAAGSPAPKSLVNPFTDVSSDAYYYNAVLWAVGQGITVGTSATTFSPNATVTRAQNVTFLWRWAKSPAAEQVNSFTDVAVDAYYYGAVAWAAEEGITGGTSATTFSPNADCTRAQIVTFLYRYLAD